MLNTWQLNDANVGFDEGNNTCQSRWEHTKMFLDNYTANMLYYVKAR